MANNDYYEKIELLKQLKAAIQEFEQMWNSAISRIEVENTTRHDKAA